MRENDDFEIPDEPLPRSRRFDATRGFEDAGPGSTLEGIVDEILPDDWDRLVRAYPIPALLLAAFGGYLLGRHRGGPIVSAVSAFAADQVARVGSDLLGRDILSGDGFERFDRSDRSDRSHYDDDRSQRD